MVAQIQKKQLAMIALAENPARKPDRLARLGRAQIVAGVRSIRMHFAIVLSKTGGDSLPSNGRDGKSKKGGACLRRGRHTGAYAALFLMRTNKMSCTVVSG